MYTGKCANNEYWAYNDSLCHEIPDKMYFKFPPGIKAPNAKMWSTGLADADGYWTGKILGESWAQTGYMYFEYWDPSL